jgi:hypothetical protein
VAFLTGLWMTLSAVAAAAGEPVALWIDSFPVTPAHTPSAVVHVKNLTESPYQGTVGLKPPEGWSLKTQQQDVSLGPGETAQLRFMVQKGTALEENSYPLEVSATGAGTTVTRRQKVVTASAPYFKPEIDGDASDWKDAIPVVWITGGKKTTIGTYWNRRQFALLVAVEEEQLVPKSAGPESFDAVQIAISPQGAQTGNVSAAETARYEFLLVPTSSSEGSCYLLATPGMKLAQTQEPRELESLACEDAEVAVRREGGVTWYECSIPLKRIRDEIQPGEGREFCLGVLVHDPDGTGIRDWGEAAGLWPWRRNRLAWSQWAGAKWGDKPPFDNKTGWGMCSSKY